MVAGQGALRFVAREGRTSVASARAHSPLRLIPTRGKHAEAAWVFTTTFGGGLVDGDAISLSVEVEPGARALLTTQASTKVHRSPSGTESTLRARIGEGALLAVINDPVVAYAGARYVQRTHIALEPGASVAYVDVSSAGRVARGERWAFDRFSSELVVEGALRDALLLDPAHGALAPRMGRFDCIATLLLGGPLTSVARARIQAEIATTRVSPGDACVESASTRGDLLVLRLAAVDVSTMHARVRDRLQEVCEALAIDPFAHKS